MDEFKQDCFFCKKKGWTGGSSLYESTSAFDVKDRLCIRLDRIVTCLDCVDMKVPPVTAIAEIPALSGEVPVENVGLSGIFNDGENDVKEQTTVG